MSRSLPTVKVVNPYEVGGYAIINESDFDSEKHTLFDEGVSKEALERLDEANATPAISHEIARNGRWTVYRGEGESREAIETGRGRAKLTALLGTLA